jgi:uroporphyrinogen decarboxylase
MKPRHRRLIEFIKKKAPSAKVHLHSCGSVRDFIPDFIDVGIEVLHPVQPSAAKMDSYSLKQEFGRDLIFHGGIDIQFALPGSLEGVRNEAKERIDALGASGGYILAPSNNIQSDTPPENIVTLYQFAQDYSASVAVSGLESKIARDLYRSG